MEQRRNDIDRGNCNCLFYIYIQKISLCVSVTDTGRLQLSSKTVTVCRWNKQKCTVRSIAQTFGTDNEALRCRTSHQWDKHRLLSVLPMQANCPTVMCARNKSNDCCGNMARCFGVTNGVCATLWCGLRCLCHTEVRRVVSVPHCGVASGVCATLWCCQWCLCHTVVRLVVSVLNKSELSEIWLASFSRWGGK